MRLKLDLSEFLNDERRLSLLCVKTEECKTVGDVIARICLVFSVGPERGNSECYSEVALFDDGFFIHPNQCSSVLEEGGVLKLQWLRSQEVKKKKNDDIELVEVKSSEVKVGDSKEWENKKVKSKRHPQENDSTQVKLCDLDTLKKKRKKKAQNIESEDNKEYKKTLEAYEIDEKVILNREAECSKSKKKKIINNNNDTDVNDVKEVVDINHGKKEPKGSKRKKNLSQEHVQKEKAIAVENIESSSEELTIVDSLKSKKCKLKKIGDTIRNDKPDDRYVESDKHSDNWKKRSRKEEKKIQTKINCEEEANSITVEAEKMNESSNSVQLISTENTAKNIKVDINQEKTDSEDNNDDNNKSGNARKRRRRRRHKKPHTMLPCMGAANIVVPSTEINSHNSRKTIETPKYNFSYPRPRNKKPMTGNGLPSKNHIIFDSNDGFNSEMSIQNIDPLDDNVTKRTLKEKLSNSLWDVSDITVLNDSHYDTISPSTSTHIIPPPVVTIAENSCNEISSTSMHKFTLPTRKINTAEENENIFGAFLEMSKSEKPAINTYVGRKVKEKSNNCTSTVSSATEQSQRRSPPKGVPTYIPQSDEVSCIFHNLLATQNFSQAFICPRTPSFSKLTIVKNTNIQPECSSTDVISSNESGMSSQAKEFTNLDNDIDTYLEAEMGSIDIQKNNDIQENDELEKEIEEMRTFTKATVEANMAEAKAAMNRRKRCRPKAISSIGNLLNRIRTKGVNPKEEHESDDSEVQTIDVEDKLEKITSTIDTNESEMCINSNESSMILSDVQTVEDENLNSGEKKYLKPTDQQVDLTTENLMQSENKNLENCEIETVDNTRQKNKKEENEEGELSIVEPDLEVSEIISDCAIVNASSDKVTMVSPKRREQFLSGGVRQSPRVTRNSIKTEITLKDEDENIASPKKITNSYNELGEAYFNQFPIMKGLPKIKEFVAVKLLSLDENLIPVYSNYQQAQVLKVQGTSITLRYIDKLEELPSKDGQLHVVDLTLEGDDATETVDWRDIEQPRLIYP